MVDNTNTTISARKRFIQVCDNENQRRKQSVKKICIWFDCDVKTCLNRNRTRKRNDQVPDLAILSKAKEFEEPTMEEGFDEIKKMGF